MYRKNYTKFAFGFKVQPMDKNKTKIIEYFNKFNGKNLEILDGLYAKNVQFQDPVLKIDGLDQLKSYYEHAYSNVVNISFEFTEIKDSQLTYFASWTMKATIRGLNLGKEFEVQGLSKIVFNEEGFIVLHRDYVDLGQMVYENIPIQGFIIKKIKQLLRGKL